jgi:hypothetical protein
MGKTLTRKLFESVPNAELAQVCELVFTFLQLQYDLYTQTCQNLRAQAALGRQPQLTGFRSTTPFSSSTSPVNVALIKKLWYTFGRFQGPDKIDRMSSDEWP